jgi:hypothetical protein
MRHPLTRVAAALLFMVSMGAVPAFASDVAPQGGEATPTDGGMRYVELDPLRVTIFRNDAPAGILTTRLVLQVTSDNVRGVVAAARLKLHDAMLREMHRLVERESRNGPKVDLDLVKARMRKIAERQLGADVVVDVFVQALLRRGT